MNKEDTIELKTLPKYTVDQIALYRIGDSVFGGKIESVTLSEGWLYKIGSVLIPENDISHLFNAGYWVHVEYWQPCKEYDPKEIEKDMYESMLEEDPAEEEFIEEQKKIFKETQALRDETETTLQKES